MSAIRLKKKTKKLGIYLVLLAQSLIIIIPLFIMINSSLKASRSIFKDPFGLPSPVYFGNFVKLFIEQDYVTYFINSITVASGSLLTILIFASLASYAIAKYSFRWNVQIYTFFIIGLMIPIRLGTINIMQLFIRMDLYNTLWSLIIVYSAMGIPAGVLILTGFLKDIPDELSDAARIDGCTETGIFIRVIVPLLSPALVVAAVYNLMPIWNDFWFAIILINKESVFTIPLATARLFGKHETDFGLLYAILTAAAVPPIVLFVGLSKYFIRGLTSGAVKG
jgi:raffinose/stachyose/melibiose transport system permease protein